jgi:hypothetical protein
VKLKLKIILEGKREMRRRWETKKLIDVSCKLSKNGKSQVSLE